MMLIEETGVPLAALPLAQFKAHLRLGTGFSEDGLQDIVLESFLRAAMAAIEARTGKALLRRAFTWTLSRWRDPGGQPVPVAPVDAITAITLRGRSESEEVIDPALYRLERDAQRPVIRPAGTALPCIPTGGTAEIAFAAGFADAWGDLPADLAQAVLLLAAHYYEYRDETALGEGCMPFGVRSLIERYRTVRLFAGGAG
ncbi:MAG: head-tail connector protein [Pseudomonadota bacterium]|uniref:head-tail connector protein n=1 Tax=Roseovarius TaxID=74030 RepID=UPI0022A78E53|nr:head-tail connector protein [Roseovarius sp. EGI FJ00037]MCZ0810700.1 head-tail connector protein [Roseovarius sp. EGI FJ00037]